MNVDNTIPQSNEGTELITCAITPKSTTNLLLIIATILSSYTTASAGTQGVMALFKDSDADALAAAGCGFMTVATSSVTGRPLVYKMVAGSTSEITFKIRAGGAAAGTYYFNSYPAAATRAFGGVAATTLTIIEFTQ